MKKLSFVMGIIFTALTLSSPARAHSSLVSAKPEVGSHITSLPSEITLRFDEEIQPLEGGNSIVVRDPEGIEITTGSTRVISAYVSRDLLPSSKLGVYQVDYRIISADGHVVTRSFEFNLVSPAGSSPPEKPTGSATTSPNSQVKVGATTSPLPPKPELAPAVTPPSAQQHVHVADHGLLHAHAKHLWIVVMICLAALLWFSLERVGRRKRED